MKIMALLLAAATLLSGCGEGVTVPIEVNIGQIADTERDKQRVYTEETVEPDVRGAQEEAYPHSVSEEKYAYQTLDAETQSVYDEVLSCILDHTKEVTVSTLDPDIIARAYAAVYSDYGGLFWTNGYVYTKYTENDEITELTFAPKYTMDLEGRREYQRKVDEAVEKILSDISPSASDYEKSKYVYETLIRYADYDESAPNNQNILSVFLEKATVCQGYSCATQYLLTQLGIESVIISGKAEGENHAWCAVLLDGAWYYMDTTFGNSAYSGKKNGGSNYINYSYLNITEDELLRNHEFEWDFDLPPCITDRDNYFVQEGLYFADFDVDKLGASLKDAWNDGAPKENAMVSWKFSDPELYDQVFEYFITKQHIGDWCRNLGTFRYVDDENKAVLMIGF